MISSLNIYVCATLIMDYCIGRNCQGGFTWTGRTAALSTTRREWRAALTTRYRTQTTDSPGDPCANAVVASVRSPAVLRTVGIGRTPASSEWVVRPSAQVSSRPSRPRGIRGAFAGRDRSGSRCAMQSARAPTDGAQEDPRTGSTLDSTPQ